VEVAVDVHVAANVVGFGKAVAPKQPPTSTITCTSDHVYEKIGITADQRLTTSISLHLVRSRNWQHVFLPGCCGGARS
jgi:hypothetical protein